MPTGECGYHGEDCGDLDSSVSQTVQNSNIFTYNQKRALELVNILQNRNTSDQTHVYWDGLSPYEQNTLTKGGYTRGVYNDSITPGVVPADPLHDPAVWISGLGGLVGSPLIRQAAINVMADMFTHNADSSGVSLGSYSKTAEGYIQMAEKYKWTYFSSPNWSYNILKSLGMWDSVNKAFIINQVSCSGMD